MRRLMIVDDEMLIRIGMKSLINWEEHGYTVIGEASNGKEAMEKIRLHQPDVVFTDLVMDVMDGFELIEQTAREFPLIKFVVLSSYNDFQNVKRALKLGAIDYIFKLTITPEDMYRLLDEISKKTAVAAGADPQKSEQADMLLRNNLSAIKGRLIEAAIQRTFVDVAGLRREFAAAKLTTDFTKDYVVMYLAIHHYDQIHKESKIPETQLLKFSLENMLNEILGNDGTVETYNYHNGALIVVFQLNEEDDDYAQVCAKISEKFEVIKVYTKRYLGVQVSAYVSRLCTGIGDLWEAVQEAEKQTVRYSEGESGLRFYKGDAREETIVVQQYVLAHLHEELNVPQIARMVHMSESYFSHVFKRDMGMAFMQYVNTMRIARAKELLQKSDLKINEIAVQVGIPNANYFSTLFKKITGKYPSQFRS